VNVLIVDDSPETRETIERMVSSLGYRVFSASETAEAIDILKVLNIDLVITDFKMPGPNGLSLIRFVRENMKDTRTLMVTGYASVRGAVDAIRQGAVEYLEKPFTETELLSAVRKAIDSLHQQKLGFVSEQKDPESTYGLVGNSEVMQNIYRSIDKASTTPSTVLILGESGTGKELVARAIHYKRKNSNGPFVPVNCGSIPDGLIESELFGHTKGAFTGATDSRAGFFQTAHGGSIFLDEISELNLNMQVKLLRVLQDKEVFMVGADKPCKVDIKIIAATNKDLEELVGRGAFREDLYYRLNVINVSVPALREREDDILLLTTYFAKKFASEFGKSLPSFTEEALKALKSYDWPGNVRELENIVHRSVVMAEDKPIDVTELPSLMRFSVGDRRGYDKPLENIENDYIIKVLSANDGNKSRTAEILKISRKTLHERLKKIDYHSYS